MHFRHGLVNTADVLVAAVGVPRKISNFMGMKTVSLLVVAVLAARLCFGQTSKDFLMRGLEHLFQNTQEGYLASIPDFDKAIALDSTNESIYYWRGRAMFHTEDYRRAMKDFTRCILLDSYCIP
jgi:hypothetical protein